MSKLSVWVEREKEGKKHDRAGQGGVCNGTCTGRLCVGRGDCSPGQTGEAVRECAGGGGEQRHWVRVRGQTADEEKKKERKQPRERTRSLKCVNERYTVHSATFLSQSNLIMPQVTRCGWLCVRS